MLPKDGGEDGERPPQAEEEEPGTREYIAVLDADSSPMAEQVCGTVVIHPTGLDAPSRSVVR